MKSKNNKDIFKNKKNIGFVSIIFRELMKRKWWAIALLFTAIVSAILVAISPKISEQLQISAITNNVNVDKINEYLAFNGRSERFKDVFDLKKNILVFEKIFFEIEGNNPPLDKKLFLEAINQLKSWWGLKWTYIMSIQLVVLFLSAIMLYISNLFGTQIGKIIEISLRNRSIKSLITADMSFYSDKKIGDILTKVVSDTQIVGSQASIIPYTILSSVFTSLFSFVVLSTIEWKLALCLLGFFIGFFVLMFASFLPLGKKMRAIRKIVTDINGDVIDRVNNIKLIKANGTEKYEKNRFENLHDIYYKKNKNFAFLQSISVSIFFVCINIISVVMILFAVLIYGNDSYRLKQIAVPITMSSSLIIGPIIGLLKVIGGYIQGSTAATRLNEILNIKNEIQTNSLTGKGIHIDEIKGDIVFKNITFSYPEKKDKIIFKNFSLTLEQGKNYAFVGETGSGKSTISKLLLRFYDPTKGKILINKNIDLKDVYLPSYLNNVGYVEQEPSILLGTVLDNLRYAKPDATEEEMIAACKKAEIHKLIMTWPNKYKTVLGERGFLLSGGQKQRIVIARMFLKDPKILILDEATSALDNIVENEIQKKLEQLMKNRTSITIAHRLSTIKNMDQIFVVAPGEGIVQSGTFKELKEQKGHFKKLYDASKREKRKVI